MNRRAFLSTIAASLTLDPERLLWVPWKKLVSIPKVSNERAIQEYIDSYNERAAHHFMHLLDHELSKDYSPAIANWYATPIRGEVFLVEQSYA